MKADITPNCRINTETETVNPENIDMRDERFRMSFNRALNGLIESISHSGLHQPIILKRTEAPIIVSGFRRLQACREIGIDRIPAFRAEGGDSALFETVLKENLTVRNFNVVEKAMVLSGLKNWYTDKKIIDKFMKLVGLESSEKLLKMYLLIPDMSEEIKIALTKKDLNPGDIGNLSEFKQKEMKAVLYMMMELGMGRNVRREVSKNIFEVCKREEISPSNLLESDKITKIKNDTKLHDSQKAHRIRGVIATRRYPILTSIKEEFEQNIHSLGLPNSIRINHPKNFEGSKYRCTFHFRNDGEFKKQIERLNEIKDEKILPQPDID